MKITFYNSFRIIVAGVVGMCIGLAITTGNYTLAIWISVGLVYFVMNQWLLSQIEDLQGSIAYWHGRSEHWYIKYINIIK